MANQTVYPYGTGGSLPSSVGIINDLTTGGVDKALSAEQGVVLREMIDSNIANPFNYLAADHLTKIISSSNVWSASNTNHDSIQLGVTPGQKYRIVGHVSNIGYYAFFQDYSDGGSTPAFSVGYTARIAISANATVDIVIPSDCHYLYICIKNAGTDQSPQSVSLLESETKFKIEELSNDVDNLEGKFNEVVDISQITVSANSSSYFAINKDSYGGILIKNITKASNRFVYISLPSGLVAGEKYTVTFKYKANFTYADTWFLRITTQDNSETSIGCLLYPSANSYSTAKFTFTYENDYANLRLAGNSQNSGAWAYIIDYSVSDNKTSVVELSERVYNLENGIDTSSGYSYEGEKIVLNPRQKYTLTQLASNATGGQSAALYDKYLFIVKDKFTTVMLYDMDAKASIYTWSTGQSVDTWHCNQSSFGTAKYDSSDMFPVLYISQRPDSGSSRGIVQAYRIIPTLSGDTITSFTMTVVQTINLPAMTTQNALGLPNATIDTEKGCMWIYSRDTGGNGKATFTKFAIPSLSSATVTLEDSNILDSFQENWSIYNNQGAFIHNGKMYMMRGVPNTDHFCECNVIDLYFKRTRVSRVDLYPNGFTYEPEGCFYYNDTVCFTVNGSGIYRINF